MDTSDGGETTEDQADTGRGTSTRTTTNSSSTTSGDISLTSPRNVLGGHVTHAGGSSTVDGGAGGCCNSPFKFSTNTLTVASAAAAATNNHYHTNHHPHQQQQQQQQQHQAFGTKSVSSGKLGRNKKSLNKEREKVSRETSYLGTIPKS